MNPEVAALTNHELVPDFSARRIRVTSATTDMSKLPVGGANERTITLGAITIAYDPQFVCVDFTDDSGTVFATAIGMPYLDEAGFFYDHARHRMAGTVSSLSDVEGRLIAHLAGSFILVTHGALPPTLYLDPAGSMPVVFAPGTRAAASTSEMLLDDADYREHFDADLHQVSIIDEGLGGWIVGGDTAHVGVHRLLPNHALDLISWQAWRHWPGAKTDLSWREPGDTVTAATRAMRQFCIAAAPRFAVFSALTAGQDTRFVLAACNEVRHSVRLYTYDTGISPIDLAVARAIARQFALNHNIYPLRTATDAQKSAWDRAVGDCILEHNRTNHPTLLQLPENAVLFSGLYGEVCCCRLYRQDFAKINDSGISTMLVRQRLTLPAHPRVEAAIAAWLAPVAHLPPSIVLDLAFWELKFGGWGMSQRPAQGAIRLHLLPIAQRAVLENFVLTAPGVKHGGRLYQVCIAQLWPELMTLPINKYGDRRDRFTFIAKVFMPGRLRRYLRGRWGMLRKARLQT